jgi:hypothetical protein
MMRDAVCLTPGPSPKEMLENTRGAADIRRLLKSKFLI